MDIEKLAEFISKHYHGEGFMNSLTDIWNSIIQVLSEKLTTTSINTWFSDCTPIDLKDGTLVIHTTTPFKRDIIQQRFSEPIRDVLRDLFSCDFDLLILAADELEDYQATEKSEHTLPEMDGYTFENFIVGKSNEYAYAAAKGVVKNPGSKVYNPLFIYGNSGLGKTHLLLAIGSSIHEAFPELNIKYVKGEDFTNQMVKSIRDGTADDFRQKYRNVELFLVDDIQFIAGKESTQEEFFHTFNSIYEAGHQIVVTSDRPPIDMLRLDERLRTRFEGSMMADVKPPDVETRMAIIRNKAGQLGMSLTDDVVAYIAEKITSNVRQIEGVVKRLTAYREITGDSITKETVNVAIGDVVRTGAYIPTPDDIIEETARYYSISGEEIKGQRRTKNIAIARHVSIYLIRTLTNLSLNDIGAIYEDRNHATILASIQKIEAMVKSDQKMCGTVRDITSNINSRQR